MMSGIRSYKFQRFGRSRHLLIKTAGDIASLPDFDEAHWVATGAPVDMFNGDATFLSLLDNDNNGRIMCFEIKEAVKWFFRNFRSHDDVDLGSESLSLDAINTDDEQGRRIVESAEKMLEKLSMSDSRVITLDQVRRIKATVESMPVSEGGVILPEASADDEIRQFMSDIVATVGGADHPGGNKGVDQAKLDEFLAQAGAYLDWHRKGKVTEEIMPLGDETPRVYGLYASLREKIDQYFAQCRAVAFDERAADRIGSDETRIGKIDFSKPDEIKKFMKNSPLSRPRADMTLDLDKRINPCYASRLAELRSELIAPALDHPAPTMLLEQWDQVKDFLSAYEQWMGAKAGQIVENLDLATLEKYLSGRFRQAVEALISQSRQTAFVLENIRLVEKLILFQAHLLTLVNNFVSFPYLYDPNQRAMFEMGTLIMDGRRFNFSIKVANRAAHAAVAKTGNMFVLYAEIMPSDGKKYEVAIPVTSGGKGNLCVGKRGVFQDISGHESDARIVQIIENPISIAEAVVSPFRKFARMLSGKIESIATSAEKEFDSKTSRVVDSKAAPAQPAAKPSQGSSLMAGGLLMGGGVALAAIGSAVAYVTQTLQGVPAYKIALTVAIAILAVVLPISIMGLVKLRKRDLSAILEGSRWAINARMRLTLQQGRAFTKRPRSPKK